MSTLDFGALVSRQRKYFHTGITRSVEWRESQLTALRTMMRDRDEEFYAALWDDLRFRVDADWTDVKYITSEVDHVLSHLRQWMKPLPVSTPLVLGPSRTHVRFDPLGVDLLIGTWNYPVMLTLSPLIAAISGGNTAVIKPSEVAPVTAELLARLIPDYLDRDAFSVVLGAAPETTALLEQQWDHIFFTGGTTVAKLVSRRVGISCLYECPRSSEPQHALRSSHTLSTVRPLHDVPRTRCPVLTASFPNV